MSPAPRDATPFWILDYYYLDKEKIATGVLLAKWDFGTKWTVKPLVVL